MDLTALVLEQSSIREEFSGELQELKVDCVCLFTEDDWQRGDYVLHEVDPQLFYPETFYAGPSRHRFVSIAQKLKRRGKSQIREYFTDSPADLGFGTSIEERISGTKLSNESLLYQPFFRREQIKSVAVFSPAQAISEELMLPEMLFLNFRQKRLFSRQEHAVLLTRLRKLAKKIFEHAAKTLRMRRQRWGAGMHRALIGYSKIIGAVCDDADGHRRAQEPRGFFERLLKQFLRLIGPAHGLRETSRAKEFASIHLLEESESSVVLRRVYESPRDLSGDENQALYERSSITRLAVLTERCHLLNFVETADKRSVLLPPRVALDFLRSASTLPPDFALSHDVVESIGGVTHTMHRLVCNTSVDEASFNELLSTKLGAAHPWVVAKLKQNCKVSYSQVYEPLTENWRRPCSELAIPILIGGQAIGCINIESERTYRWNPTTVNVLSFLARVIGSAVARHIDTSVLDAARRCAATLAVGLPVEREQAALDQFASRAQQSLLCRRVHFMVQDITLRDAARSGGDSRQVATQPVYYRLASSIPDWRSRAGFDQPRKSGWTARVAQDKDSRCLAYVFKMPETPKGKQCHADCGWRILLSPPTFAFAQIPSGLLRTISLNITDDLSDCRFLVATRLRGLESDVALGQIEENAALAVMWSAHRVNGAVNVGKWRFTTGAAQDLQEYLTRLHAVSEDCAIISAALRPRGREFERMLSILRHGYANEVLKKASESMLAMLDDKTLGASTLENVKLTRLLVQHVQHHIDSFAGHIDSGEDPDFAVAYKSDLLPLHEILNQSWEIAKQLFPRRDVIFDNRVSISSKVLAPESYLRSMLVAVLVNCIEHGCDSEFRVKVSAMFESKGHTIKPGNPPRRVDAGELIIVDEGTKVLRGPPTIQANRSDEDAALGRGSGLGRIVCTRIGTALSPWQRGPTLTLRDPGPGAEFRTSLAIG